MQSLNYIKKKIQGFESLVERLLLLLLFIQLAFWAHKQVCLFVTN